MRKWNDDPFTKKARKENYEARSVYKLEEIDRRENVLKGAKLVVDLGAAPGSWTQYVLKRLPNAKVIAVDLSPLGFADPRVTFFEESIETVDLSAYPGADVVLSDMAPKTSGVHERDVALSFELATLAFETAKRLLKPGGGFVVKLFMGESFEDYQKLMKGAFESLRNLRPESTRKHSREIFLIGKGFKPS